jgi:hypothetical protein
MFFNYKEIHYACEWDEFHAPSSIQVIGGETL